MAILMLVRQYALCVYIFGTRTIPSVAPDYIEPVKRYAAENYTLDQINNALAKGYITEQEHAETIAYIEAN